MTTNQNGQLPASLRNILTRYTSNSSSGVLDGQTTYGLIVYLQYLGHSPLGIDNNLRLFGSGAGGLNSWWYTRFHIDRQNNPWIKSGVERLAHLVIGAGIELATRTRNCKNSGSVSPSCPAHRRR